MLHGEELNKRVDYLSKNVNTIQDSFQKWKEKSVFSLNQYKMEV